MTDSAYEVLLWGSLIVLAVSLCFCLFRAVLGPRFTDRIVAVNIISTKCIIIIAVIGVLSGLDYLLDVALVYAMIGFLSVVVLSKCYLLKYQNRPIETEMKTKHSIDKEEVSNDI